VAIAIAATIKSGRNQNSRRNRRYLSCTLLNARKIVKKHPCRRDHSPYRHRRCRVICKNRRQVGEIGVASAVRHRHLYNRAIVELKRPIIGGTTIMPTAYYLNRSVGIAKRPCAEQPRGGNSGRSRSRCINADRALCFDASAAASRLGSWHIETTAISKHRPTFRCGSIVALAKRASAKHQHQPETPRPIVNVAARL